MPYGEKWRQHRRLFQEGLRDFVEESEDQRIGLEKVYELLVNLLKDPNNFRAHIRTWAAATIIGIMYGHDVASNNDYFVDLAEKALGTFVTFAATSGALVNIFPFMRYLPAWFPGCGFQYIVREGRDWVHDMVDKPYSIAVDNMRSTKRKSSILAKYLDRHRTDGGGDEQELMIKQVCATAYAAGADTTVSALSTFFMAMASYPHVQKKAQTYIDDVLAAEGRLPTWEDRSSLQYVEAIVRETLRWAPVAPLGFFHSAASDDTVDGYFVPQGTALSGNIWAMTRDPTVYPDPENFIPERFLKEDGTCNDDDVSYTFGFG
ncbi:hypothetical protein VNI00_006035 [Paramarasmius palmivorus]|uniref:Cytochrome P450 n=1 Tax=Paramarasmius palmivorus TaxID=297713 RepID=A0AAW0DF69_9AGAR